MQRDFSLNHWDSIYSFSLRIQYTKLQCCSFETLRAQWAIRDYLNERFPNDKLLKLLVKYHSIIKSVATPKRQIKKVVSKMKSEIRTETSWMDQAGTNFRRLQSFSIQRPENWWKEKVGCRFHQIRVQI